MNLNDGLIEILKIYHKWNKCRLDPFVGILLALIRLKQLNLTQLALGFASEAIPKSRYRCLQRFFEKVVFDYDVIASHSLIGDSVKRGNSGCVREGLADFYGGKLSCKPLLSDFWTISLCAIFDKPALAAKVD